MEKNEEIIPDVREFVCNQNTQVLQALSYKFKFTDLVKSFEKALISELYSNVFNYTGRDFHVCRVANVHGILKDSVMDSYGISEAALPVFAPDIITAAKEDFIAKGFSFDIVYANRNDNTYVINVGWGYHKVLYFEDSDKKQKALALESLVNERLLNRLLAIRKGNEKNE